MNILPHKSWHVRTKKNIARVRADEAKAAEEEKEKQRRIALAAQEARTRFLRERASQRVPNPDVASSPGHSHEAEDTGHGQEKTLLALAETDLTQPNGHINFFQDIEDGTKLDGAANKEHEEEKKKEQEEYEKKIGYLVYLGQNSLEHSKDAPWYARIDRNTSTKDPKQLQHQSSSKIPEGAQTADQKLTDLKLEKLKEFQDPLKDIRKYLSTPGVKAIKTPVKKPSESKGGSSTDKSNSSTTKHKKFKKEKKKKHKKDKKHKAKKHSSSKKRKTETQSVESSELEDNESESDDEIELKKKQSLERLRAERLEREKLERRKAEKLLEKVNNPEGESTKHKHETRDPRERAKQLFPIHMPRQKYNSQFNPHLARQNYDN